MNTNPYSELIAQERAKIAALKARIRDCENRIAVLESAVVDELDDALSRIIAKPVDSKDVVAPRTAIHKAEFAVAQPVARPPRFYGGGEAVPQPSRLKRDGAQAASDYENPFLVQTGVLGKPDKPDAPVMEEEFKTPKRRVPTPSFELLRFLLGGRKTRSEMAQYVEDIGHPMSKSALSTFVWAYRTQYGLIDSDDDGAAWLSARGKAYLQTYSNEKSPEPVAADSGGGVNTAEEPPQAKGTDGQRRV